MFKTYVLNDSIDKSIEKTKDILEYATAKEPVKARISAAKNGRGYKTTLIQLKEFNADEIMLLKDQLIKKFRQSRPDFINLEVAPLEIAGYKYCQLPTELDKAIDAASNILKKKKGATKAKISVRMGNNIEDTSEIYLRKFSQQKIDSLKSEVLTKFGEAKDFDQILLLTASIGKRYIKCPNCEKEMRSDHLTSHLKKCVTENFCPICQREVTGSIKDHMEECNRVQYRCRTCGEGFSTGSKRAAHEKSCQVANSLTVVNKVNTSDSEGGITAIGGTFRVTSMTPKMRSVDYEGVLEDELDHLSDILELRMEIGLKFYISVELKMHRITDEETKKIVTFQTNSSALLKPQPIKEEVAKHFVILVEKIERYIRNGSGWMIENVEGMKLMSTKYNPMGGSYIQLPQEINKKTSLLNITNRDNKCFLWSCLASIHADKFTDYRQRVEKYYPFEKDLNMDGITYPVTLGQICKVEKQNDLSINVYTWDKGEGFYPLRVSDTTGEKKEIHLLLIANEETQHYVLINNLSGLLSKRTKHVHKMFYCPRCLHGFTKEYILKKHREDCKEFKVQRTEMPFENHIEFTSYNKMIRYPVYIVADFESIISKLKSGDGATKKTGQHIPCAYALKVVSRFKQIQRPVESYRGENAAQHFILRIHEIYEELKSLIYMDVKMEPKTAEIRKLLASQVNCHICEKPLGYGGKDIDHCHYTAKILGYAHPECNRQRKTPKDLPIIFHNFKGYDCHLLIKELCALENNINNVHLIPKSMEQYTSVSTEHFKFIDSAQHLQMSLEKLVDNLKKSGNEKFKKVKLYINKFHGGDVGKLNLLLRKGVYPYSYMDSFDKFEEALPDISAFYDDLNVKECSKDDYAHVKAVFHEFGLKSLGDLCNLYVTSDVLLLADVFQEYIVESWKNFGLDPLHYYTAPGLTWDACLKMTKVKLEMIKDKSMYMFCEKAIRGGVSVISKRKAVANNKYMTNFDTSKPSNFLWYVDANNLYGKAMVQKQPISGFKWCKLTDGDIINYDPASDIGYLVEVDLSFPNSIHDKLNCFPIAPEPLTITEEIASAKSLDIRANRYKKDSDFDKFKAEEPEHLGAGKKRKLQQCGPYARKRLKKTTTFNSTKLAPNLLPKQKYICHIRNLQFYLKQGAKLEGIHRVLQFNQTSWIEPYIMFNTRQRQADDATEFKKSFHKLLNNAFFGKTMESVRKRINIVLIRKQQQQKFQISKPGFKRFEIFGDDLVGVELIKPVVKLNKPVYVGATVLELSKLTMFEFWYNVIKPRFPSCTLCFTDTDSLLIDVPTSDLYADIIDIKEHLDLSNYPESHKLYDPSNKACLGKFKDECSGNIITQFVGLRSKCYSLLVDKSLQKIKDGGNKEESGQVEQKNVAAGVKKAVKNFLEHEKYQQTLSSERDHMITQNLLRSYQHTVHSVTQTKVGLTAYDDKRHLLDDGETTRAHGHYLNYK